MAFLDFIRQQAAALRSRDPNSDQVPSSLEAWETRRPALRKQLFAAWGVTPEACCDLEPMVHGRLERDGYRVEKITFQTLPGLRMAANLYLPAGEGKRAAVLCVHGHWRGAKQDRVVQSRCIGLAKLGFVVLCVDALGAGERAIGEALGEYHGEMVAATLFPVGKSLAGLQVFENLRAIDYLVSRPEVDATAIGVTGASGGGNQTMYIGALDERLKCVVPVCSVGNYQAYLGAACCMCEVTPGALKFTEEWAVLGLVAPRALMVVSATKDSFQFSVDQAKISLAKTSGIYELYQQPQRLRHAIFESPHDYNREMREAMYGWMALHLRGEGDGSPIAEPELMTEEPEELRCYPQGQRPADFVTLPQLAARFGREALAKRKTPDHLEFWMAEEAAAIQGLPELLGGFPKRVESKVKVEPSDAGAAAHLLEHLETIRFQAEEGIELIAWRDVPTAGRSRLALILDAEQGLKVLTSELSKKLREQGWDQAALELRATGGQAYERDKIGRAADHTTAEWSLWIGRPLVGQWVWDVVRLLDAMAEKDGGLPEELMLVGQGTAATVALIAGALHPAVDHVVTVQGLASFVTEVPYVNQRLGLMVPGLLPSIGDVAQLAALVSPRRLTVCGGVDGGGNSLDAAKLEELFQATRVAYRLEGAGQSFRIIDSIDQLQ